MKTLVLAFLVCSTLQAAATNSDIANENNQPQNILELSGNMSVDGAKVADYFVYIFENGVLIDTFFVDSKQEIFFDLDFNRNYAIKFVKAGYKERILLVDTHIADEGFHKSYTFRYDIEFLPHEATSNTFDDFPVAFITFQENVKDFDYDRKYHSNVRINPSAKETAAL